MILLTSSVVEGDTIIKGRSLSFVVYEDQSDPEWYWRSPSFVDTFSSPTIDTMSVQQASRFNGDVLCFGPFGGIDSKGAVDNGDRSSGLIDPNQ